MHKEKWLPHAHLALRDADAQVVDGDDAMRAAPEALAQVVQHQRVAVGAVRRHALTLQADVIVLLVVQVAMTLVVAVKREYVYSCVKCECMFFFQAQQTVILVLLFLHYRTQI